jgi:hypothetical protein
MDIVLLEGYEPSVRFVISELNLCGDRPKSLICQDRRRRRSK